MQLIETLRTTGAVRNFRDEPVPPEVLHRVLDTARFAPSGGNKQAWHVVVVEDPERRRELRDLYLDNWQVYVALGAAGLRPWAPITDRAKEAEVIEQAIANRATRADLGDFAEHFDEVPVMLVLLADLRLLAAVDRDLDRYSIAGGASIYPFAWNLLLAAREEGLGGVITTVLVGREAEAKALLGIPETHAIAAVLALGHPVHQPTKLRREPVETFATVDAFDGPPLEQPVTDPAPESSAETPNEPVEGRAWIRAWSAELGVAAPTDEEADELLDLAGVAAHSSERIAAPLACYLVGRAGITPESALVLARRLAGEP